MSLHFSAQQVRRTSLFILGRLFLSLSFYKKKKGKKEKKTNGLIFGRSRGRGNPVGTDNTRNMNIDISFSDIF